MLDEIKNLALANDQFNELISFPLMTLMGASILDIISSSCFSFLYQVNLSNTTFILQFCGQLSLVVYLNGAIQRSLKRIGHFSNMKIKSKDSKLLFQVKSHWQRSKSSSLAEPSENISIQVQEMHIYEHYFALRLFNLCQVDLPLVLEIAFFSLNYVVLITQTQ